MAIRDDEDVANLLGTPWQSERVNNFVWLYLCQIDTRLELWNSTHYPQRQCWEHLQQNKKYLQHVRSVAHSVWIPDRDLTWLIEDWRQVSWVQRYVDKLIQSARAVDKEEWSVIPWTTDQIPVHLVGISRSVALLDYWSSCAIGDVNQRRISVQQMEAAWLLQGSADRSLDWLNGEDGVDLRRRFWERILQHFPGPRKDVPAPNSHDALLGALDSLGIHPAELKMFSEKTKGIFRQQQRRANDSGRRQCNFVLQNKTVSKLDNLARKHGVTRTEIIELLVQEEALNPVHTAERLRRLRAFTAES